MTINKMADYKFLHNPHSIDIKLKDFSFNILETSRSVEAQSVTVKPSGCGFDPHSRRRNIYLNLYFHFFALVSRQNAALSSATQHAMPPEFGRKWGTECLNTRFPLPFSATYTAALLCAGYSVKLIWFDFFVILFGQASCGAAAQCDCKTEWLWVRSPLDEMKYLLKFTFPFLRSGLKAKRGVEFCHSTCSVRDTAWRWFNLIIFYIYNLISIINYYWYYVT